MIRLSCSNVLNPAQVSYRSLQMLRFQVSNWTDYIQFISANLVQSLFCDLSLPRMMQIHKSLVVGDASPPIIKKCPTQPLQYIYENVNVMIVQTATHLSHLTQLRANKITKLSTESQIWSKPGGNNTTIIYSLRLLYINLFIICFVFGRWQAKYWPLPTLATCLWPWFKMN